MILVKMRSILSVAIAAVASFALAGATLAAGAFTNGSFENTSSSYTNGGNGFETLASGSTAIPGWTVGGGGVDWINTYWNAEDGSFSLDMNATSAGSISQTFATTAGARYQVSFWLSGNPVCGTGTKTLTVGVDSTGATPASYQYAVTTQQSAPATLSWVNDTYTFVASGSSTTLTFSGDPSAGACGPALDNVALAEAAETGASCKDGGWKTNLYLDSSGNQITFKNQGACVSYFATRHHVPIGH